MFGELCVRKNKLGVTLFNYTLAHFLYFSLKRPAHFCHPYVPIMITHLETFCHLSPIQTVRPHVFTFWPIVFHVREPCYLSSMHHENHATKQEEERRTLDQAERRKRGREGEQKKRRRREEEQEKREEERKEKKEREERSESFSRENRERKRSRKKRKFHQVPSPLHPFIFKVN
jgi:hypothetical protein